MTQRPVGLKSARQSSTKASHSSHSQPSSQADIASVSETPHNSRMSNPEWRDAYDAPFDPCAIINAWVAGDGDQAAAELWLRLYHQGTVGTASYQAVPELVRLLAAAPQPDWNAYALIASIEEGRLSTDNPAMPIELEGSYRQAWEAIVPIAVDHLRTASEDQLVRSLIAVIAQAKQQRSLAAIALCTEDERQEMLGIES